MFILILVKSFLRSDVSQQMIKIQEFVLRNKSLWYKQESRNNTIEKITSDASILYTMISAKILRLFYARVNKQKGVQSKVIFSLHNQNMSCRKIN